MSENIVPTTPDERRGQHSIIGDAEYKSGYRAKDLVFTVYYIFNAGKLVAVELVPNDLEDGPKAAYALEQIYGATIKDESGIRNGCTRWDKKWRSEKERNVIWLNSQLCPGHRFSFLGIRYEPILSSGAGL